MVGSKPAHVSYRRGLVVGRAQEMSRLRALLTSDGSRVVFVHGLAGVGKSTLLHHFAASLETEANARVIVLDCREIEPTDPSFLAAVAGAVGSAPAEPDVAKEAIGSLGAAAKYVVLCLDHYEVFRLLDTWLRQRFVPALPANVSLLIASRIEPNPAWNRLPAGTFAPVLLGPLGREESAALTLSLGVKERNVDEISRLARGHPLTLVLGALAARERREDQIHDVTMNRLFDEFADAYLNDLQAGDQELLEAAAVVRRVSIPLLEAMLPRRPADEGFAILRQLPFVDVMRDGLALHSALQESVATRLRAAAPSRYRELRKRAWVRSRDQLLAAPRAELWRHTADMIYLLENPAVRGALFPTEAHRFAIEPARPTDAHAIKAMIERHEPRQSADLLQSWWSRSPDAFRVARDSADQVVGFAIFSHRADLRRFAYDPVVEVWQNHMRDQPISRGSEVLLVRRWLTLEEGDLPSEAQASLWLDLKRTYMELRPGLRRVYSVTDHPDVYGPALHQLEAEPIARGAAEIGGRQYQAYCLDMGPSSVDGWLTRLAARELGVVDEGPLDVRERRLVVDGDRVDLTPREFEVMAYLHERPGDTVTRTELLAAIWGYDEMVASNVVDAVIHTLRKKLGNQADTLETVRGVGYRLLTA